MHCDGVVKIDHPSSFVAVSLLSTVEARCISCLTARSKIGMARVAAIS